MALLQLPALPRCQAGGVVPESSSSNSLLLSSASHFGAGCDHLCFLPRLLGGYGHSSHRTDFRRSQGSDLISTRCYGGRQDGGYAPPRTDSRRTNQGSYGNTQRSSDGSSSSSRQGGYRSSGSDSRRNDFDRESSSGGGSRDLRDSRDDYSSSGPDSRRSQGNDYDSRRSSGGRQDRFATSRPESRRTQGGNYNSQRSGGGENSYGAPRPDSRRGQGNEFYSPRNGQSGNDRDGYGGGRNRSSGADSRGPRSGTKVSGRYSKPPIQVSQTITPRQSTSQFVSDRTVHRAPWEQGGRKSSSSSSSRGVLEQDVKERNPLVERLQRMQEEVEIDDEEDDDDEDDVEVVDDHDFRGLRDDRGPSDLDDEGREVKSAMARIVEKLSNIPGSRSIYEPKARVGLGLQEGPDPTFSPKYGQPMFPTVGRGWSTPDNPLPAPAAPPVKKTRPDTRFPWEREDDRPEGETPERLSRVKPPSLAELTVPEDELKRLRSLGILTRHRIKVGKLGVTNGIVESIHNEWRNSEVVRVKCEGPPAQNMKRTHETLEERTGGLVVWRAGGACLVYRGKDYVPLSLRGVVDFPEESASSSAAATDEDEPSVTEDETEEVEVVLSPQAPEQRVVVARVNSIYDPELEKEMEEILSTLGPRYDDWTGMKPIPVDADLLGCPDGKFKRPFRRLPYGVKPSLTNMEMTNLRRLGRPIPPHFVLGVNRGLEGLAAAIIKLWEKSEIAKIAVKRGVQNTNHERMAEHLKRLTGGVLLARDKYFIVLYRGKDFLPPLVAAVLEERQAMTAALQEEEEKARLVPQSKAVLDTSVERSIAGTLAESLQAKANWENLQNSEEGLQIREEAHRAARNDMMRRIKRKIFITQSKKDKAEVELQKVEKRLRPAGPPMDRENITDEERHMFSKLGLKMHAFLLLGRRGVFDGTVENMHLHWKHRELVKIIYKARDKIDLEQTARMLEYESGGILVATVPTNKGQAIMVYRGKNYQRPPELRPRTLLTKRQALKRSLEMQRQKALTKHLLALEKEIEYMQTDLNKLEEEEEDQGGFEPTANDSEEFLDEEETKDSIIFQGFELPKGDGELTGDGSVGYLSKRGKLDAIFRADPLSRREKLVLRQQALKERKRTAHFNVGRSNVLVGLARAIRIHFQRHALVKVGVRGRAMGTPVEEILHQLEEATGGTLVSQESSKVILYRGWPEGQDRPTEGNGHWEELSPELRSAMISEAEADDDYLHESDWDDSGDEEEDEDEDEDEDEEDEDSLQAQATLDNSYSDDDSDWDEFDDEDDEGDYKNELELGLGDGELVHNEGEEEDVGERTVVHDAV